MDLKPIDLTEQQIEFVLGGYAAYMEREDIIESFHLTFPNAIKEMQAADDDWAERLDREVQKLYPGHPQFPEIYRILFQTLRSNYLGQLDREKLSSTRYRLKVMAESIEALDALAMDPKQLANCERLKLEILKAAAVQANDFFDRQTSGSGATEEDIKGMVAKLSDDQLIEFRKRVKAGADPDLLVLDLMKGNFVPADDEVEDETEEAVETEE